MNADFFLEMLVKSGGIAGAAALGAAALKSRPAAERANLLRAGVCALLALPVLALVLPAAALLPAQSVEFDAALNLAVAPAPLAPETRPPSKPLIEPRLIFGAAIVAYLAGVAVVLTHLAIGLAALRRWTRSGRIVTDRVWTATRDRLCGGSRAPVLIESAHADGPLSWGYRPGAILLPPQTLAHPEHANAVLAHEIAHFRRNDWAFLILARIAVALFWFNPLVWAVHWMLAHETEEAADAAALDAVKGADYAQTLVSLSRAATPIAAHGMSGSPSALARRIRAVLASPRVRRATPMATALTLLAVVTIATPLAAVELRAEEPKVVRREVVRIVSVSEPPMAPTPPAAVTGATPASPPAPPAPAAPPSGSHAVSVTKEIRVVGGHKPKVIVITNRDGAHAIREIELGEGLDAKKLAEAGLSETEQERILEAHARAVALAEADAERLNGLVRLEELEMERRTAAEARALARAAADAEHRHARHEVSLGLDHARNAMREGAAHMREEAQRLREERFSNDLRERARDEGRDMTASELKSLSDKLEQAARKLELEATRLEREANGLARP